MVHILMNLDREQSELVQNGSRVSRSVDERMNGQVYRINKIFRLRVNGAFTWFLSLTLRDFATWRLCVKFILLRGSFSRKGAKPQRKTAK